MVHAQELLLACRVDRVSGDGEPGEHGGAIQLGVAHEHQAVLGEPRRERHAEQPLFAFGAHLLREGEEHPGAFAVGDHPDAPRLLQNEQLPGAIARAGHVQRLLETVENRLQADRDLVERHALAYGRRLRQGRGVEVTTSGAVPSVAASGRQPASITTHARQESSASERLRAVVPMGPPVIGTDGFLYPLR